MKLIEKIDVLYIVLNGWIWGESVEKTIGKG